MLDKSIRLEMAGCWKVIAHLTLYVFTMVPTSLLWRLHYQEMTRFYVFMVSLCGNRPGYEASLFSPLIMKHISRSYNKDRSGRTGSLWCLSPVSIHADTPILIFCGFYTLENIPPLY